MFLGRLLRSIPHSRLLWTHRRARPLFDQKFYLARYPDVARAGADPWLHYLMHGAAEQRKPHALFDPVYYLIQRPESGAQETSAEADPLLHFMQADHGNWANPHPLFDCNAYLRANPSLPARRLNPLIHYLRSNRDQAPASEGGYFGAA